MQTINVSKLNRNLYYDIFITYTEDDILSNKLKIILNVSNRN